MRSVWRLASSHTVRPTLYVGLPVECPVCRKDIVAGDRIGDLRYGHVFVMIVSKTGQLLGVQ